MKKSILTFCILIATVFSSNVIAQITGATLNGAILPKKECEILYRKGSVSITGNNNKDYWITSKKDRFTDYSFTFNRTGGNAKTTVSVYIDGIKHDEWVFDRGISFGTKTISITDVLGKDVLLKVKNHSATDKIVGNWEVKTKTNSMLYTFNLGHLTSNETITERITQNFETSLIIPCNNKGTIEVTRLNGTSSAEIVVTRNNTVIKVEQISSNETSKRINLNNITGNGNLKLEIRNIQTNQFIRARIGAWFN